MNRIVLVAVGGSGMSAVARLFWKLWFRNVIGIDKHESELTKSLQDMWMTIHIWHAKVEILPTDYVIYSAAAAESVEVQTSLWYIGTNPKKVFPPVTYFQFLGEISKYFFTIAISGTHGKSTTTALAAQALKHVDPDFGLAILWAWVADRDGDNMTFDTAKKDDIYTILQRITNPKQSWVEELMKKYSFVVEACEYKKHFLTLDVDMAVVTNIELDHADVYKDIHEYVETFEAFARKVRRALLVLNDNIYTTRLEVHASCPVIQVSPREYEFKSMLGAHNHLNASLAQAVIEQYLDFRLLNLGVSKNQYEAPDLVVPVVDDVVSRNISAYIQNFAWLRRRGEVLWTNQYGVPIITDYAHHPSELKTTISAVREKYIYESWGQEEKEKDVSDLDPQPPLRGLPSSDVAVIFQPHQARRVVEFRWDFVKTLRTVPRPVIYDIYTAREQVWDIANYDSHADLESSILNDIQTFDQLGEIFAKQCSGVYMTDFDELYTYIQSIESGVILVWSAGDVDRALRKRFT